jgi:hypothetical protein
MCTYDEKTKKLCLDLETRNLLLDLIKSGVAQQIEIAEFLFNKELDKEVKDSIICGLRTHFDCLLPEIKH